MFKLLEEERSYLDLLKETKMLKHVGSGPVDPAPKEKETKSPVEDGTGAGTKQASTGHPNKIPPLAYLKKELAKEGIQLQGETTEAVKEEIMSMPSELKAFVKRTLSEMKEEDEDKDEKSEGCPECKCDPCECEKKVSKEGLSFKEDLEQTLEHCGRDHSKDKKKVSEQADEDAADAADDTEDNTEADEEVDTQAVDEQTNDRVARKVDFIKKKRGMFPGGKYSPSGAAKVIKTTKELDKKAKNWREAEEISNEQGMVPRGSTADKIDARSLGKTASGPVAGSPADRSAKMAAFEKQKAVWAAQQKQKAAALPANVIKQRRPVMA